jgi:parallel beta-helix repeat protein
VTEGNLVYDNVISDSEIGIRVTRSHGNIVENTTFSDIESSEYRLLADSIIIGRQDFDNVLISGDDSVTGNLVEIVASGIIEVTKGERDEEDGDGGDDDEDEGEGDSYNTDIEPFRRTLGDDDEITVNSS